MIRILSFIGTFLFATHSLFAACNCHELPFAEMDDVDHNPPMTDTITYVRAGRLIDTEKCVVLKDQLIAIQHEKVLSITPWQGPPKGDLIDWSKHTVLPGLIDCHAHLVGPASTANVAEPLFYSAADDVLLGCYNARVTLEAGFTSVHDVGVFRALTDVSLKNAIENGYTIGPRMNVVGAYIQALGGGGEVTSGLAADIQVPADYQVGVITSPNDVRLKVNYLLGRGADSIKLMATGAVMVVGGGVGIQELTNEEIEMACKTAAQRNSWVVAHANSPDGIINCINGGVRAIEHASLINDEGIALAKKKGVFLDMDIYCGSWIEEVGTKEGWHPDILRKNRETTEAQREGFRKAVKAGCKMTFGTDSGIYPHGKNARQFKYMVQYGMTPMQAIQAATVNAAELLMWSDKVGSLSPGHYADMIAVDGDPLQDISTLENVRHVIKGGVEIK